MKKAYYYLLASPIYLLALLPFPVFYFICDIFYVLTYHIVGYRKKIVYTNLRNAFPDKTEKEINTIAKAYYHFMIDLFLETFKLLLMSEKQLKKRVLFDDLSMIYELKERKQNFLFVMGHYGNWEWCGQSFHLHHIFQQDVLYHPLSSPFFEWLMMKIRTRFGVQPIPMASSIREMIKRKNILNVTAFLADQTPSNTRDAYWMYFLNQDTPVLIGTEKIAKKLNCPVVFVSIRKIKRGYYNTYFQKITDDPQNAPEGYITEAHTRMLEEEIIRQPETWLWSHRRWKHKRV
jgi:KDO2-lipid IV(A) lauroyltransferase